MLKKVDNGGKDPLAGTRILVVEDEPIIAMSIEDMLKQMGCVVVASVGTVRAALAAVESTGFDAALLDVNLNGASSLPVAAALRAAGRPFLFTTGYGADSRFTDYADVPVITKPYRTNRLAAGIATLLARQPQSE